MSAATEAIIPHPPVTRGLPLARFVLLNVLGGLAVLGSYAWGVTAPGVGAALWGGVPDALRPLYTTNMLLAAAGYFFFTAIVARRLVRGETAAFARRMVLAYAAVLVPSALWVPLTAWMLASPSLGVWALVRLDLLVVGGAALLLFELVLRPARDHPAERWFALAGLLPFTLQTLVLDALVWPYFFGALGTTGGIAS